MRSTRSCTTNPSRRSSSASSSLLHRESHERHVPVSVEELEPPLFLATVAILVWKELPDQLRLPAVVPERLPVLEDQHCEEGPVAAAIAVEARRVCRG